MVFQKTVPKSYTVLRKTTKTLAVTGCMVMIQAA